MPENENAYESTNQFIDNTKTIDLDVDSSGQWGFSSVDDSPDSSTTDNPGCLKEASAGCDESIDDDGSDGESSPDLEWDLTGICPDISEPKIPNPGYNWDFTGGRSQIELDFNGTTASVTSKNSFPAGSVMSMGGASRRPSLMNMASKETWAQALVNVVTKSDFLVLVDQNEMNQNDIDKTLASIAALQSQTIARSDASDYGNHGKELDAITDDIGCGPYTFSEVYQCSPSSLYTVVDGWIDDGIRTLVDLNIKPPADETERRMLHFCGVGDTELLRNIFNHICTQYRPSLHSYSINNRSSFDEMPAQYTQFYMMWGLFPEEASKALGIPIDHHVFKMCMDYLENRSRDTNHR